ncbi:hypothetical protein HIM_03197 [Hirsutella minnesotensis 3608]|nr:hypothetical protein HIM_03197 [Hirsutella minnesotensis 3608]
MMGLLTIVYITLDRTQAEMFPPRLSRSSVVFQKSPLFGSKPSPNSDAAWNSLLPNGGGYVRVESPERFGLNRGVPTEDGGDQYWVSMFHQLHCLKIIRENYFGVVQGQASGADTSSPEAQQQLSKQIAHVNHCFDYLRQAVMCNGDMTLEWATPEGKSMDGWNIDHQCRSWDQAVDWTLRHKAPDNGTTSA